MCVMMICVIQGFLFQPHFHCSPGGGGSFAFPQCGLAENCRNESLVSCVLRPANAVSLWGGMKVPGNCPGPGAERQAFFTDLTQGDAQ